MKNDNYQNINSYIGRKIKSLRQERGLSQKDLADKFKQKISSQQVQKYESGTNQMSAARLLETLMILDIDIGNFFSDYYKNETCNKFRLASNNLLKISDDEIIKITSILQKLKDKNLADDFLRLMEKMV